MHRQKRCNRHRDRDEHHSYVAQKTNTIVGQQAETYSATVARNVFHLLRETTRASLRRTKRGMSASIRVSRHNPDRATQTGLPHRRRNAPFLLA